MIDRRQRQPPGPGNRLGSGDADEQRADQPGARCHTEELDVVERGVRFSERLLQDGRDELEVTAGRHLGHDAAVARMQIGLRRNDVGQDPPVWRDHRRSGLVARSLEPEDQTGRGSGSRHMISASSRLSV